MIDIRTPRARGIGVGADDIIRRRGSRLVMRQHIQGIDHVVVVVRDLDDARNTFARMGFTLAPRGFHTLGSQNHCVMFGNDYLELLFSPTENPHPSRQYYTEFASHGEGLAAIALQSGNAKGAYTELLWAGFRPTDPEDFSRPVELPEGKRDARFRITQVGPGGTPGGRVFVCQHFTRELVWRPELQRHVNGATGLAAVAILCDNPAQTANPYERLLDRKAKPIAEGLLVETGGAPIAFVTAPSLAKRLPDVWISARSTPVLAALFVRVGDRAAAAAALKAGGLTPATMPDGSIAIGADVAHGVAVVFG
jgi:catechol 2,3-dioxygenase-like lactoylglutathione lyase family enzyme